jgi:hypothetical protein
MQRLREAMIVGQAQQEQVTQLGTKKISILKFEK